MKISNSNRPAFSLILISLLILAFTNATAQVRVTKVTDPEMLTNKFGIVYALPQTQIHAELWVTKTQRFAGPLAAFSREYIGVDNATTKNEVSYSIENLALWTSTAPDPGQVYLIEKQEKSSGEIWISFGKSAPVLTLEKFDKTVRPDGFTSWNKAHFFSPEPEYLFRKYTDSPVREVIDTITRKISMDTLVIEEMIFKRSMVEFSDREKAQEAAERIGQIDQDIYKLLIGYQETAYSRETMEFMYNKLEEQKLEYMKLFTGVTVAETLKFDFQILPVADKEKKEYVIAGFTKINGIISPDGKNDLTVSLRYNGSDKMPGRLDNSQSVTGIVYRIPMGVLAVLSHSGRELASRQIEVLQLGSIQALPPDFKRVEFDLETGALKAVVLE
jgi:hypothetical protein